MGLMEVLSLKAAANVKYEAGDLEQAQTLYYAALKFLIGGDGSEADFWLTMFSDDAPESRHVLGATLFSNLALVATKTNKPALAAVVLSLFAMLRYVSLDDFKRRFTDVDYS